MLHGMAAVLGLSGGIATGKSTVTAFLSGYGAAIVDADVIVRELQAPGAPLLEEISKSFGSEMLDASGALDRAALGTLIFGDAEARARLDKIVHPKVGIAMAQQAADLQAASATLIVLDIPLLFENRKRLSDGGSAIPFDATVLVYAPEQAQLERQIKRDGCMREDALRRIQAQLPIEEKKSMADIVIDNSGSIDDTERQTHELFRRFTSREG
jgi:dephospho-CoA kinase